MDRFNSDKKLFAFILSTRSGGMGINLTGADTVIFYDSDWNPAMDAQAQDRAHRIGQTRDVHIYRMVTSSTVEENILLKANQKRHLQKLSVEKGKFNTKFFEAEEEPVNSTSMKNTGKNPTQKEIDYAMAAAEDAEDRAARRRVNAEELADCAEFTELGIQSGSSGEQISEMSKEEEKRWSSSHGKNLSALEAALPPIQRLALHNIESSLNPEAFARDAANKLKEEIQGMIEHRESVKDELTRKEELLELELDYGKRGGKRAALVMYRANRRRILKKRKIDLITGRTWVMFLDEATQLQYYYCTETGRKVWNKPDVLVARDLMINAHFLMYQGLSTNLLVHIFCFLSPLPDRMNAGLCCPKWLSALRSNSLSLLVIDENNNNGTQEKHLTSNVNNNNTSPSSLYEGVYYSLSEAVSAALPGHTIHIKTGLYKESDISITKKVKILGQGSVVLLVQGAIKWYAKGGEIRDIEIRSVCRRNTSNSQLNSQSNSKLNSQLNSQSNAITIENQSKVSLLRCDISNKGGIGAAVCVNQNATLIMMDCSVHHSPGSGFFQCGGSSMLSRNQIYNNNDSGIFLTGGTSIHMNNTIKRNKKFGACILPNASACFEDNLFMGNEWGSWDIPARTIIHDNGFQLPLIRIRNNYGTDMKENKKHKTIKSRMKNQQFIQDMSDESKQAKHRKKSSIRFVMGKISTN
eukprot:GSMAST32.ASY1.ANO1.1920.1 assembled CDS